MEFGGDNQHHHRDEEDEDEEEEGSEEVLAVSGGTNPNNHHRINSTSSSLNRLKMVEASFSQVQIHQPITPTPPPPSATSSSTSTTIPRFSECLRNHAINVTGHALDGCGEFMPGGPEGSVEALKCAACSCHRNFHRKEDPTDDHHNVVICGCVRPNGSAGNKKRFMTKFTAEQKEMMLGMTERIGWRIQKCDDDLVQQFCNETGVKRHGFKVGCITTSIL